MKIIYLLPPSEGKNIGGNTQEEGVSFGLEKPYDIAKNATEKDLKCKGKRYEEGIYLNTHVDTLEKLSVIERYSGVMYNAIGYIGMSLNGKKYFDENFFILSGMYGILKPTDIIGNYKLPIETKGLYKFWGNIITDTLNHIDADIIIDFLPGAYAKMIQWGDIRSRIVRIDFLQEKNGEIKKMTHGVKKVKGEYIRNICQKGYIDIPEDTGNIEVIN